MLLVSHLMWCGALDSSSVLLSYPTISLASHVTTILIIALKHIHKHIHKQRERDDLGLTDECFAYGELDPESFLNIYCR